MAAGGTTLLVSSHVMEEASHCSSLLLLRDGLLLAQLTPAELAERGRSDDLERAFLTIIKAADRGQEESQVTPVNLRMTSATATRVLRQLRHDRRSVALILVVPALLLTAVYFLFENETLPPGVPPQNF